MLVADIGEMLARHADARGPGLPQTIHKVPFLFRHRTLLVSSSSVLLLARGIWSREKSEENAPGGAERCAAPEGATRTALSTIRRIITEQEVMA